ncbi:MAG TPA: MotA/TolQ/ExbB proton channel family protein, partial [Polyangiaceae bacterium]|nr:MotA/TolQ/ExbB proton channel family protein [Polyangiaceae bacterium]
MSISSAPLPDPSSPPATTAAAPAPIPRPTGSDGATATVLPLRPRTTASPVVTVPVALALMALLLALKPALQGSYVGVILFSRGWVQYAIVGCTFWSLGILASKALCHLSAQRPAFRLSCLPHRIEQDLDMATAREICQRMGERFAAASFVGRWALQRSLLFARVYRVLEAVAAGRSLQDASGQQQRLADTDADAVESSFASVRVFVWAIPILGFIGTVLGIGEAVGGFSQAVASAEDLEVIKKSLSGVTTGLAVAFDTTLLALVMSIVVMLPMSALQRLEEGLLGAVDDYTGEHVLS